MTGDSLEVRALQAWCCGGRTQIPQPQKMSWMKNNVVLASVLPLSKDSASAWTQSKQGPCQCWRLF